MTDWDAFFRALREPGFIPGYEIQNRLGGGAFGEVYKARKTSIGKPYAIKFLKLDEEAARAMAERELEQVRLFAAIDHPNLVTIEDCGMAGGVPYLIMGYAGEDTLAKQLSGGDLPREKILKYFVQACRGVLALHDRRLAHFDLKPSNIFLKGEVARVGDYGLAKLISEGGQSLSFGRGTPLYMAPEMMRGRADHRADVYSLGVILYECLLGRLPFDPEADADVGGRDRGAPLEFPGDVSEDLRGACAQALQVDPEDRQVSVHELLEQLGQTSRQGESVHLRWPRLGAPAAATASAAARRGEVVEWESLGGSDDPPRPPVPPAQKTGPEAGGATLADLVDGVAGVAEQGVAARPTKSSSLAAGHAQARRSTVLDAVERERGDAGSSRRPPGGTVPVPPTVEGGMLGAAGATLVLGVEVMATLLLGPVRWLFDSTGRGLAAVAAGDGGALAGSRAVLVLIVLALASAMVGVSMLLALVLA